MLARMVEASGYVVCLECCQMADLEADPWLSRRPFSSRWRPKYRGPRCRAGDPLTGMPLLPQ